MKRLKTLVLDLDETLVHSANVAMRKPDICFQMASDDNTVDIYAVKRPFVKEFLSIMSQYFEIVVFTASIANYAEPLLDSLEKRGFIDHRLFRRHCTLDEGGFVKDLDKLGRDLKDVVIIDNSPYCFKSHPENGIHIKSFLFNKKDKELLRLIPFLIFLSGVEDVRDVSEWHESFRNHQYIEYHDISAELRILDKSLYVKDIIDFFTKTIFAKKLKRLKQREAERKKQEDTTADLLGLGEENAEEKEQQNKKKLKPSDPSFELIFQESFYLSETQESVDDLQDTLNESLETTMNDETFILDRQPFDPRQYSSPAGDNIEVESENYLDSI